MGSPPSTVLALRAQNAARSRARRDSTRRPLGAGDPVYDSLSETVCRVDSIQEADAIVGFFDITPDAFIPQVIKNLARQGIDDRKYVTPTGATGCNTDLGQVMADLEAMSAVAEVPFDGTATRTVIDLAKGFIKNDGHPIDAFYEEAKEHCGAFVAPRDYAKLLADLDFVPDRTDALAMCKLVWAPRGHYFKIDNKHSGTMAGDLVQAGVVGV
jgi:hypothetical protein